ncbi:hypothetical protein ACVWZV_001164 [Bradyrhizobium sp. GM5.1]
MPPACMVQTRRALGTGVAHRFEDVTDLCDGIIGWDPGRGIVPGGIERALAGVWIGAVLRPAVLFAFVDGAGLLQQVDSPAAQRPDRLWFFLRHQHRNRLLPRRILGTVGSFPGG